MKTLAASLLAIAFATGAGQAQLSTVTDTAARTTQETQVDPAGLQNRTDVTGHARQSLDMGRPMSRIEQMRLERAERDARRAERAAARAAQARGNADASAGAGAMIDNTARAAAGARGSAEVQAPDTAPVRREAYEQANRARREVNRVRDSRPSASVEASGSASSSTRADTRGNASTSASADARADARVDGPDPRR